MVVPAPTALVPIGWAMAMPAQYRPPITLLSGRSTSQRALVRAPPLVPRLAYRKGAAKNGACSTVPSALSTVPV